MSLNLRTPAPWAALLFVAAVAAAGSAHATHAVPPTNLKQQESGATGPAIVPGTLHPTGTVVWITATAPSVTNGTATYEIELEIREVGQAFTGTPTHSAGVFTGAKSTTVDMEFPGLTYTPTVGSWKWQTRMKTTSTSTPLSTWVLFNAGNTAFEIAPPNVPDIMVEDVFLTQVDSNQAADTLQFTVNAKFKNRGAVPTGPFVWKAYLSTNKTLDAADTLLFTATDTVDVAAESSGTALSTLIRFGPTEALPRPPPGAYYVVVEADPHPTAGCTTMCGDVHEFDESNNVGSMPNYFLNGVDLVATSISNGPANAQPGTAFNLTVDFFNQGVDNVLDAGGQLKPVKFQIVASRTQTISTAAQVVYQNFVTVEGSQVFNLSIPITLPAGVAGGQVWWALILDPQNEIPEGLETNNVKVSAASSNILQADLEAGAADMVDVLTGVPIRTGDIGQPARFKVASKNVGNYLAIPHKVGAILSTDNNLSLLVDVLVGEADVSEQAIGSTVTRDITITLPTKDKLGKDLPTGDYYFFLWLDSSNLINEVSESNNISSAVGPIRLRRPAPDYAITQVRAPTQAAAGDLMVLERQIKNLGTDPGPTVEYACYASANQLITPADFALPFLQPDGQTLVERGTVTLAIGGSDSRTETVQVPSNVPAGNYYVGCIVDPDQTLAELTRENNTGSSAKPVAVVGQAFQVATVQLQDASLGLPYQVQLATVSAPGPVTWTAAQVSPGLSLGTGGTLSGTPTEHGIFKFTAEAKSGRFTASRVLTVRALPPTTQLTITTDNLPPVINSTTIRYQGQLSAAGGAAPYQWAITSGILPNGLLLDPDTGVIAGNLKPGVPNNETTLTVRVRGGIGGEATRQLKIRVMPPGSLAIVTLGMPNAMVGADYVTDLSAAMGTGLPLTVPLQWTVTGGTFPPGLILETHLDKATGLVSGKPTVAGTWKFTLQVRDGVGRTDTLDFVMTTHSNALRVSWETAPPTVLRPGEEVDLPLQASSVGGATFRLFSGGLPPGLELTAAGRIQGQVAMEGAVGVHNFAISAKDPIGAHGLAGFTLEVRPREVAEGCSTAGGGLGLLGLLALTGLGRLRRRRRRS